MRRVVVATFVIGLVATACGEDAAPKSSSPTSRESSTTSSVAPQGSADSAFWIAEQLPTAYQLVIAENATANGIATHRAGYRQDLDSDPSDAELTVESAATDLPARGEPTTIRGHRGVRVQLTDEGRVYGVSLAWQERRELVITVSAGEPLTEADARLVADHVRPVPRDFWRKLTVGTDPVAVRDGTLTPDMERVEAAPGTADGDAWVLTALLPPGYPLLDVDRRAACYELAFRSEHTNGTSCVGHPSWQRVAGQVFVIGEAPEQAARVRVAAVGGNAVEVSTASVGRGPNVRFWVAPMPDDTCDVTIRPVGKPLHGFVAARTFGDTGPLSTSEPADWTRCSALAGNSNMPRPAVAPRAATG